MSYLGNSTSFATPEHGIFSLGLTFLEIMDLQQEELDKFLVHTPRKEIIDWLQWNDPNGVYNDKDSISEFGNILSREEGVEILKRQLSQQ